MLSVNRDFFPPLFSILYAIYLFDYLFSSYWLGLSYNFLVPDLREKTSSLSPWNVMSAVDVLQVPIVRLRKFLSVFSLLGVLIMDVEFCHMLFWISWHKLSFSSLDSVIGHIIDYWIQHPDIQYPANFASLE